MLSSCLLEEEVQAGEQDGLWQVTCPCGWRTHGRRAEVVAAVIEHGRAAHGQQLTESQVMDLAVRYDEKQGGSSGAGES